MKVFERVKTFVATPMPFLDMIENRLVTGSFFSFNVGIYEQHLARLNLVLKK